MAGIPEIPVYCKYVPRLFYLTILSLPGSNSSRAENSPCNHPLSVGITFSSAVLVNNKSTKPCAVCFPSDCFLNSTHSHPSAMKTEKDF